MAQLLRMGTIWHSYIRLSPYSTAMLVQGLYGTAI